MHSRFSLLVAASAALMLAGITLRADPASAQSQLAFSISLSSGTLNVSAVPGLTTGTAYDSVPASAHAESVTTDGYAFASAGTSSGIGLTLNADDYFLADVFATTEVSPGVARSASATALSFYDLTFSNVTGPTLTLTLTPLFYINAVPPVGVPAGLVYGYASAFLSLGDQVFVSFQNYGDGSGYADFTPLQLTVDAGETVQLNLAVTAGLGVPDTAGTLGLFAAGLLVVGALRRTLIQRSAQR